MQINAQQKHKSLCRAAILFPEQDLIHVTLNFFGADVSILAGIANIRLIASAWLYNQCLIVSCAGRRTRVIRSARAMLAAIAISVLIAVTAIAVALIGPVIIEAVAILVIAAAFFITALVAFVITFAVIAGAGRGSFSLPDTIFQFPLAAASTSHFIIGRAIINCAVPRRPITVIVIAVKISALMIV